jgi:hypothetical protein
LTALLWPTACPKKPTAVAYAAICPWRSATTAVAYRVRQFATTVMAVNVAAEPVAIGHVRLSGRTHGIAGWRLLNGGSLHRR